MSRKTKILFVAASLIILAVVLAGCGKNAEDTPWHWAQTLKASDIESAVFWCSPEYLNESDDEDADDDENKVSKRQEIKLSEEQLDKLFIALYRLEESDFSENTTDADKTPVYGLKITMADGSVYEINRSEATKSTLEMSYADKLWSIDNATLNEFVCLFLIDVDSKGIKADDKDDKDDEDSEDDEFATDGDLEPTDLTEYASDGSLITREPIDYSTYSDMN